MKREEPKPLTKSLTKPLKNLAPRNRTIQLTEDDRLRYRDRLLHLDRPIAAEDLLDRTICQDLFTVLDWLPANFVDLLFLDPPYNLDKVFHQHQVRRRSLADYTEWLDSWLAQILPVLKPEASIYLCGDWQSSPALYEVASRYFTVRNRITWEREKGRSAHANWKNCAEDIWFCTVSERYYFDAQSVRLRRRVRAPYTDAEGQPKDWQRSDRGNFRLTAASNLWTDLTIPFWSMPENTDHPTQKPEKLLAKIILASCPIAGVVLDPFLGSGTTSVVAKKLDRHFVGIEIEEYYACLAEKRLELAADRPQIQGWRDRVFWERNSQP